MPTLLHRIWRRAKSPFSLPLGPVQILLSLRRRIKVSNNYHRRARYARLHPALSTTATQAELARPLASRSQPTTSLPTSEVVVVVGAGPGFGHGVAERLSAAGFRVALACRNAEQLDPLVDKLRESNPWVRAYGCDATRETSVIELFQHAVVDLGPPTLVVYAVQEGARGGILEVETAAFESAWRSNCLGAFLVVKEAGRRMVASGQGTIALIGATSGLVGRNGYVSFAVGKFGLRAIAQVAARELGPHGVHVAHLIIDADIAESDDQHCTQPTMNAIDVAEVLYQLHRQPGSAWTHELDARPFNERFWEHC